MSPASSHAGVSSSPLRTGFRRVVAALILAAALSGVGPVRAAQRAPEIWPQDWFSDLPATDLTGIWLFDPTDSDPMLTAWADREVRYEVRQHTASIVLDFQAGRGETNSQTYRWDGSIQRFERGGRQVEEAARWAQAGRVLEIAGRHWDPEEPDNKVEYRFTYSVRGDRFTFVQQSDSGSTRWTFVRERPAAPNPTLDARFR